MTATTTWNTAELVAKDKAHLLHPVSNLSRLKETGPLVLCRADGVYIWDTDGNRYIDGLAGLWNINVGHGRHELAEAAANQIDDVAYVPTFFGLSSPPAIELAAKLAGMFPGDLNHIHFTSGGAESNESALKIARYYWWLKGKSEKIKIISRRMGYHGIAMGALAATGIPTYHEGFGPGVPGYVHVSAPYAYRNGEGLSDEEFVSKLVDELEAMIAQEGADTIAAFIGEPVQGAGGVVVPPAGYWPAIIEVLEKHDILLIADEVICGFGRTGSMFGAQTFDYVPDISVFAKGVTSGYIPLGGVAVTDEIFDTLSEPDRMFMHGFTYSGHPVACAVGLVNTEIIENEDLATNAVSSGDHLRAELHRLLDDHSNVGEIRGIGMMTAIEFVADRTTKAKIDPATDPSGRITAATRAHGAIVRPTNDAIAVAPPLITTKEEATELAEAVAAGFDEAFT